MNVEITYLLSEQAQRAQMVATGQPVARQQEIVVDLSVTDLDVCYVHEDGTCLLDCTATPNREALCASLPTGEATYGPYRFAAVPIPHEFRADPSAGPYRFAAVPIPHDIPDLIRRGKTLLAAQGQAVSEAAEAARAATESAHLASERSAVWAFRADPSARGSRYGSRDYVLAATPDQVCDTTGAVPGGRAVVILLHPDAVAIRAEIDSRNAADARIREEADAAKEAAKTAAISVWVTEHGTDSQRARLADGLLSRDEVLAAMAEFAFSAMGVPAAAEYRSCKESSCPCGYDSIQTLDVDTYAVWASIKPTLPGGYGVKFFDNRECPDKDGYGDVDDEAALSHLVTASLTIPFGPFHFTREIALA